jgi:hypothetical protein
VDRRQPRGRLPLAAFKDFREALADNGAQFCRDRLAGAF